VGVRYLILGVLLVLPVASLAQSKPTYSDSGRVEGFFGTVDETRKAPCGDDARRAAPKARHQPVIEEA
jgi:hypothetical protein